MASREEKRSSFERRALAAIQTALVALIAWAGLELVNLGKLSAVLEERLSYQGDQITDMRRELREWSEIYMRKDEANDELGEIRDDVRVLDRRVSKLEGASDEVD